jgi:hypothetical protein
MSREILPEILSLFDELNAREVRYMVVGMSAAIMQGVPATTQDIDVWFERYSILIRFTPTTETIGD